MVDLYLQAMLQGQVNSRTKKTTSAVKDKYDEAIEHEVEQYIAKLVAEG